MGGEFFVRHAARDWISTKCLAALVMAMIMISTTVGATFATSTACAKEPPVPANLIAAESDAISVNPGISTISTESKKIDLGRGKCDWNPPSFKYTGKPIKLNLRVTVNKKLLKSGRDYKYSFANNINVGTARIIIRGIGNYTGQRAFPFKIIPADLGGASISHVSDQTYTGKPATPKPTLTFNGKALKAGVDYTLAYKSNQKPGKATVVAKGKGNFTGLKTTTFSIKKKSPNLKWKTAPASLFKNQSRSIKAASASGSKGAVTYVSSNKNVVAVNAKTGAMKAVGVGDAVVSAKIAANGVFASQTISRSVRVKAKSSGFGFYLYGSKRGDNYLWGDLRVGASAVSGNLRDYVKTNSSAEITYFSSTPEVFAVNAQGKFTAKRPGYARICIAQRSNDYYPSSHVFINVAVKTTDGKDVSNAEWKACDALATAAWDALGAGTALGQGNLPIDTVVGAVFGADTGNALYNIPQLNSVLTRIMNNYTYRLGAKNAPKAIAQIAKRYGIKTGTLGICVAGSVVYAYHLSENTNHTQRFQNDVAYRESAEALMREESWQSENGWLEHYRIGQLEGWLQSQSIECALGRQLGESEKGTTWDL